MCVQHVEPITLLPALIWRRGRAGIGILMAELNQDSADVANLDHFIKTLTNIGELIAAGY